MNVIALILCLIAAGFATEPAWGQTTLPEVGRLDMDALVVGVDVAGQHAFLAARSAGLRVVDLIDPTAPRQVGVLDTTGVTSQVQVVDGRAYLADSAGGVVIADVSVPQHPRQIAAFTAPGSVNALKYANGLLYLGVGALSATDSTSFIGLMVYDVANPAQPVERGRLALASQGVPNPLYRSPTGVDVAGTLAAVSVGHGGTFLVDVASPAAMRALGNFYAPQTIPNGPASNAVSVRLTASALYVGNR